MGFATSCAQGPPALARSRQRATAPGAALPVAGKYALLRTRHERVWTVVEFSGVKGVPLKQHPGLSFTDWRAAEWAVFQLRWRRHVGRPLSFEDPGLLERLAP